MGCCDTNLEDPHFERVQSFWPNYVSEVKNHSVEAMAKYFQLTMDEANSVLENHPELTSNVKR